LDVWASGEGPWHLVVQDLDQTDEWYFGSLTNRMFTGYTSPVTATLTHEPTQRSFGGTSSVDCVQPPGPAPVTTSTTQPELPIEESG
jgi:hypothetical protein